MKRIIERKIRNIGGELFLGMDDYCRWTVRRLEAMADLLKRGDRFAGWTEEEMEELEKELDEIRWELAGNRRNFRKVADDGEFSGAVIEFRGWDPASWYGVRFGHVRGVYPEGMVSIIPAELLG